MLYPKYAEQLVGKVDALLFSIDSTDAKSTTASARRSRSTSRLEALAVARKLSQPLYISHVVTNESFDNVDEMIRFAKDQGAILYLNPCFSFFGNEGLDPEKAKGLVKYFGKPGVIVDRAQLALIASGGNTRDDPVCRAVTSTVVISPENKLLAALLPLQGRGAPDREQALRPLQALARSSSRRERDGRSPRLLRGLHGLLLHAELARSGSTRSRACCSPGTTSASACASASATPSPPRSPTLLPSAPVRTKPSIPAPAPPRPSPPQPPPQAPANSDGVAPSRRGSARAPARPPHRASGGGAGGGPAAPYMQ